MADRERGRPTIYSEELAERICNGLKDGRTLRSICRDDGMPDDRTVRNWAADPQHPFSPQYTRAREIGYQTMADELLEISDDGSNDWMEREGKVHENGETIARSRLRVDTRKWLLSKCLPKIYGDRTVHQHEGGETPIKVDDVSADARKVAFMLGRAMGRASKAEAEKNDS